MNLELLRVSLMVFLYRFKRPSAFSGSAIDVCEAVIAALWNGRFYQTGLRNFSYFWMRDFGTVVESLISLGKEERAAQTVTWAIGCYQRVGRVTSCLSKSGKAFDAPKYCIDTLPWFLRSIRVTHVVLNESQKTFLEKELQRFGDVFLDNKSGLIKAGVDVMELRDAVRYKQSAYALTMLAMCADDAKYLGIRTPLQDAGYYKRILVEEYWNGEYFNADKDNSAFSMECNLFPLWLGVITDEDKILSVLKTIQEKNLTSPYPAVYTDVPEAFHWRWWARAFMPNYAGTTVWTWLGAVYVQLLHRTNSPEFVAEFNKLTALIERHHNFPELLNADGSWYKTPFYQAEGGMIWSALYLDTAKGGDALHV